MPILDQDTSASESNVAYLGLFMCIYRDREDDSPFLYMSGLTLLQWVGRFHMFANIYRLPSTLDPSLHTFYPTYVLGPMANSDIQSSKVVLTNIRLQSCAHVDCSTYTYRTF